VRFLMSGGGTAGHIYPALAVAEELRANGRDEVLFVGTPDGLEARLVAEAQVPFSPLPARGFDRSRPVSFVTSSAVIATSTIKARSVLKSYRPDVVVGFGGYVSIPVGLAAARMRVPLVLHEQNSVPGLANRQLSRWAASVAVTYAESASLLRHPERAHLTGNPVRSSVRTADRASGRRALGVDGDERLLLVFGGSRGARHLNTALVAARERLIALEGLRVVHVAGRAEFEGVSQALDAAGGSAGGRWALVDYIDDMGSALAAADLVVARAGATSIAEITALGRPSVLIPYPYATDDHQTKNAESLASAGAAVVISDAELDTSRLGDVLVELLTDDARRATMAAASRALGYPDATRRVADMAREAAGDGAGETRRTDARRGQEFD
jgi:UDP-N-acetylglucosamine--N-acetylmuramyl-(pentapeptide) pyrophosphoryl-undecaprenol N-acetylglucosamine transferase